MHAKRQEINLKQHKKSWNFWWQSSKCVNSEIAGWHKMEEKAVHGDDAALKSQVVFLEWNFSRVQPKRVNIACAPRGCCKFIKRDSLTRSSSATTTVTHRVCLSSWDLIHSSIFFSFSTLLLSVYFSHLYQSHSLTSVFWHLIFAFLSSLNLLLVVYSSPWAPRALLHMLEILWKITWQLFQGRGGGDGFFLLYKEIEIESDGCNTLLRMSTQWHEVESRCRESRVTSGGRTTQDWFLRGWKGFISTQTFLLLRTQRTYLTWRHNTSRSNRTTYNTAEQRSVSCERKHETGEKQINRSFCENSWYYFSFPSLRLRDALRSLFFLSRGSNFFIAQLLPSLDGSELSESLTKKTHTQRMFSDWKITFFFAFFPRFFSRINLRNEIEDRETRQGGKSVGLKTVQLYDESESEKWEHGGECCDTPTWKLHREP